MLCSGYLYLPKFSLENKTVLDIGACCGETANIYLKAGAKKVICIEPDHERLKCLDFNRANLCWNVEVISEKANPKHIIESKPDLIKCDIEGYENGFDRLPPKLSVCP
jgi:predicted RNA methylase